MPPLPLTRNFPFQPETGIQASKMMFDTLVGLIVPRTRQIGTGIVPLNVPNTGVVVPGAVVPIGRYLDRRVTTMSVSRSANRCDPRCNFFIGRHATRQARDLTHNSGSTSFALMDEVQLLRDNRCKCVGRDNRVQVEQCFAAFVRPMLPSSSKAPLFTIHDLPFTK